MLIPPYSIIFYTPADDCVFVLDFILDKYTTQEIKCNKVVCEEPVVLKYCLDPCKN